MALPDQLRLQAINQIAESLSSGERRSVLYLCGSLDTDDSVACMKEMLKCKVMREETGHLLLSELMLVLRRFDILRNVCKTSRDEVERSVSDHQILPKFRILIANISEDMASDDLDSVKFLLGSNLPCEKAEKAKSFLDVVNELEKMDIVSSERVDFIQECLMNIDRVDLAKKVAAYKMSVLASGQSSSQQQRCTAPHPFPTSNSSHHLQQTRQGPSRHSAAENIPVSLYRGQRCQSQLDSYKFNTNPRGLCVIIDCVGNDGDMLEQTFKALHFKVILHKLLSVDDTLAAFRGILSQSENFEGDGFVCCVISRGPANFLMGTDSYGVGLRLDNLRHFFTSDACPMLAGKPKLFFIQRYSMSKFQPCARMNHRDEDLETDGCDGLARCDLIPSDADVFWSHCWTDDSQLEQGHHSSIYLKALTDALRTGQRRRAHLVELHTQINGAIYEHNRRNPAAVYHIDLKHTLRKSLCLQ